MNAELERQLQGLSDSALESVSKAATLEDLESVRVDLLGRKGRLTELLKGLKDLSIEDKRLFGSKANGLKTTLGEALERRRKELEAAAAGAAIAAMRLDLSLPGRVAPRGRLHPITRTMLEMADVLASLGFSWAEGPHIESDHYNFESLNFPPDHPARDCQDTFFLDGLAPDIRTPRLLRTHTSPVQVRYMEKHKPPIRIIAPGRVFRHDAVDASHSAVFHQIEGLYVDRCVTMADLKGTLDLFIRRLFGPKTRSRFRPSFFPFTEPSAEVDVECLVCGGKGCPVCKQSGWLEMLGAGMVHPNVLRDSGIDPETHSGYAWGMGVDRFAMLKFGITDIRLLYENDIRFLDQFE